MPKELLKITHLKDGVCQAESHCESDLDRERTAAALLSLMDQDPALAKCITEYVTMYILQRRGIAAVNRIAMAEGKKKTQN